MLSWEASANVVLKLLKRWEHLRGPLALVVEEEPARPADPLVVDKADATMLVVHEAVYHYGNVADIRATADASRYFKASPSGYPLNAFVLPALDPNAPAWTLKNPARLAGRGDVIVNGVFDYGGCSVWMPLRVQSSPGHFRSDGVPCRLRRTTRAAAGRCPVSGRSGHR